MTVTRTLIAIATVSLAVGALAGPSAASPPSVGAAGATFSEPSKITNAWLPLSAHRRWVLRGVVDGNRVRADKRLLGRTAPGRGSAGIATPRNRVSSP